MISKICLNNEYIQILHFSEDETTALFHRRFVRPRFIKYPWYKLSTTEKCSVFKEINKEKSSERKRDRISACWTELAEPSKFIRIVEGITQVSVFRQGCTIYLEITEFNAYYGPNKSKLKCRCLVRMLKNWINNMVGRASKIFEVRVRQWLLEHLLPNCSSVNWHFSPKLNVRLVLASSTLEQFIHVQYLYMLHC